MGDVAWFYEVCCAIPFDDTPGHRGKKDLEFECKGYGKIKTNNKM